MHGASVTGELEIQKGKNVMLQLSVVVLVLARVGWGTVDAAGNALHSVIQVESPTVGQQLL